jgi:YbaB/EbfC DNA-binding family protein
MQTGSGEYLGRFLEVAAETDETLKRTQAVRDRVAGLAVTERSPDGAVEVTVDRDGAVTNLKFLDPARRLQPSALSSTAMHCIRRAQGRLGEQYEQIVRSVTGDDESGRRMVARYRQRYPQLFQAISQTPSRPRRGPVEPDYEEGGSILLDPARRS